MSDMKTTSFVISEDEDLDIEELVVRIKRQWKKLGRPSHPINKSEVIRAMLRTSMAGDMSDIIAQLDEIAQERRDKIEAATRSTTDDGKVGEAGQDGNTSNQAAEGSTAKR